MTERLQIEVSKFQIVLQKDEKLKFTSTKNSLLRKSSSAFSKTTRLMLNGLKRPDDKIVYLDSNRLDGRTWKFLHAMYQLMTRTWLYMKISTKFCYRKKFNLKVQSVNLIYHKYRLKIVRA